MCLGLAVATAELYAFICVSVTHTHYVHSQVYQNTHYAINHVYRIGSRNRST